MNPSPTFPHAYLFREVGPKTLARKQREDQCKHWGCANLARPGGRDCETCKSRKARLKNMTYYAYTQVRTSAAKRDISFELTFKQFKIFDKQTGYVESKGRELDSLTIDRIDPTKGYSIDNIRTLTWSQNCAKAVNGMTDPVEPIARAIAKATGDEHYKYMAVAEKVLNLLAQQDGGFHEQQNPF